MPSPPRLALLGLFGVAACVTALHWASSTTGPSSAAPARAAADKGDFDRGFAALLTADFKALPAAERVAAYRSVLSVAEGLGHEDRGTIGNRVGWVLSQLVRALLEQDQVVEALAELRQGRLVWGPYLDDNWRGTLSYREARALQRVGVLDLAERHFTEAVECLDRAVADRPTVNVGGWLNAHMGMVEYLLHVDRTAEALARLEAFAGEVEWGWIEERIGARRVGANRARILSLRGHALAGVGGEEETEEALAVFAALHEAPDVSPAVLFSADASRIVLRLEQDPRAEVLEDLEHLEKHLENFAAANVERDIWHELVLATARERCGVPEPAAARAALRETLRDFRAFRRENPLPGGVAASRYRPYRDALERAIVSASGEELIELLIEQQAVGRQWEALGRPEPAGDAVLDLLCTPGSGVLVYVRGELEDRWVAFGPGGVPSVHPVLLSKEWLPDALDDQALLETAPDRLSPRRRRERPEILRERFAELAGILLPPELRQRLKGWKRVYLVGREELSGLSVEGLPVFEGQPFGCSHALVDLPSLNVAPALEARARASRGLEGLALVADARSPAAVTEHYGIPASLELTEESLRDALGLEAGGAERIALHGAAVPRALQPLGGEGLLHLVVHGLRDPYRELSLLLALTPEAAGEDGLFGVGKIRNGRAAPVVFLSVCSGADSPPRSGDAGANHLGGAFIEAGAHSVVLSPGEVHLDASLAFFREVYRARAAGEDLAEAVRLARCALRADPDTADPFHWAQVRVFGIGR